jgi:hypothetical protein
MAGLGIAALLLAAGTARAQEITPSGSAVTASTNDGNLPGNAVDNNTSTRWSGSGDGAWLQLDLGSVRSVGYVTVAFYKGNTRKSSFDIMLSSGSNVWTKVLTATSNGTSNSEQKFDFPDQNAQFVRYVGHGNDSSSPQWNSLAEVSVFAGTTGGGPTPTPGPTATPTPTPSNPGGTWKKANLTNFESYPDPNSDECTKYNGCTWAGQFAFVSGKQPLSWVKAHNIAAVHQRDANKYKLKTLRLQMSSDQIDVVVYDMCADSDCSGCCTRNANEGGIGFLIDIEKYTMQRFHHGEGVVNWQCTNCN